MTKPKSKPKPKPKSKTERDQFSALKADLHKIARMVRSRTQAQPAKITHDFWRSQRDPDKLLDEVLDHPVVKATWGSLRAEVLQGGVGWMPPPGSENDPRAVEAARFLNDHDELTAEDRRPLTMEAAARSILQAVPRGFALVERTLAPASDPVATGKWSGFRRMMAARWVSRRLVDIEEDEWGYLSKLTERVDSREVDSSSPEWWRYVALTWDEDGDPGTLYGNGLGIVSYEFVHAAKQVRQAWRSVCERVGGGAVIATLDAASDTEFEEVAEVALEMLDGLLTNFIAVLPKGMDVQPRDLLAKNAGDVFKAIDDAESRALQLLWVYQVGSTGTDDSGSANSRSRTESLQEEKSARAEQIAHWLVVRLRQLFRPLVSLNFGPGTPMPMPVLGQGGLILGDESAGGGEDIQAQALNGAQVGAIQTALQAIPQGTMSSQTAAILIEGAAPGVFSPTDVQTMVNEQAALPPPAAAAPAPAAATFDEGGLSPLVVEDARLQVRSAATRKLRRWFEEGRDVDCSTAMPLRTEFRAAYQSLGLDEDAADEEAQATCRLMSQRMAESLPLARTIGGRLRVLSEVASELADPERLSAIHDERGAR